MEATEEAGLGAHPGYAVREGRFGATGSLQEVEFCLLFPVILLIFICCQVRRKCQENCFSQHTVSADFSL